MRKIVSTIIFLIVSGVLLAQTQGPSIPTTLTQSVSGNPDWVNISDGTVSNDAHTTVTLAQNESSEILYATDLGFTIPAGATIDGVEVVIERHSDNGTGTMKDVGVKITLGGSLIGNFRKETTAWGSTDYTYTYGGPTDLWGNTLSDANINDITFGVALQVKKTQPNSKDASVDAITIKIYYTSIPLPIELLWFNGNLGDNGEVVLDWATASEINNYVFEIERMNLDSTWSLVGVEESVGNSSNVTLYSETIYNISHGDNYYRLKQIDFDGEFEIFKTINVYRDYENKDKDLNTYPNPSNDGEVNIELIGFNGTEVLIVVLDIHGRLYYEKVVLTKKSGTIIVIDSKLLPGTYSNRF